MAPAASMIAWYKANESAIAGIAEPITYTKGQVIADLPKFIQNQINALSFPATSIFYRNAYDRLVELARYLKQHHNAGT